LEPAASDLNGEFNKRSDLYGCDMIVRRSIAERTPFDTRLRSAVLLSL